MSHSKNTYRTSWIQAALDRANSSRETALLASVPLLQVVSEKTCNIVEAAQHAKDNKAEQGLVIAATASTEAFCNPYRHSTRQASWPWNGVKALLHALSGILGEIEQYLIEQMDKSRATRFFNSASNASRIRVFLQRLEIIVNKLENMENVTESVTIALRDFPYNIGPLLSPGPSPNRADNFHANDHISVVQGHISPTAVSASTREIPASFTNTAMVLSQPNGNTPLTPLVHFMTTRRQVLLCQWQSWKPTRPVRALLRTLPKTSCAKRAIDRFRKGKIYQGTRILIIDHNIE